MKKLIALLLACTLLTGCQLASEKKNEDPMDDKLVGVFITFDDLDLGFDMEGYFNDHAGELVDGGEIVIEEGEAMAYEGKLWAQLGEDGWSFPGYEGLLMGQMWQEDHWAGFSTEGFCERYTHVTQADTMDGIEEEGTIYVPRDTQEFIFYSNPVYMTPEGEYYAVQGNGFSSGNMEIGGMSQNINCEITWTEDGVEYTYSADFTTRIEGIDVPERIVLIHMSAENQELSREEHVPGQMPESVTPAEGTSYIIVEEYAGELVTRSLYQPENDSIQVFYRTEKVYCLPQYTTIEWNE